MASKLWKNQISNNLKQALLLEIEYNLTEDIKRIKARNKELEELNKHKTQLIRRLKKTLSKEQGVEIHKLRILKDEVL